MNRYQWMWNE